eukprot:scaffold73097_cov48-Phaeocystis_antarctica.AAC.2
MQFRFVNSLATELLIPNPMCRLCVTWLSPLNLRRVELLAGLNVHPRSLLRARRAHRACASRCGHRLEP